MSLLSQGGGPRHVSGVDLAPCICAGLLPRELNVPDPVSPSGLGLHVAPMGLSEEVRLEKTRGGHSGLPRSSIKNCRLLPHPPPAGTPYPCLLFSIPQHVSSSLLGHLLMYYVISYYLMSPIRTNSTRTGMFCVSFTVLSKCL